jgi:hypothetical protein
MNIGLQNSSKFKSPIFGDRVRIEYTKDGLGREVVKRITIPARGRR